MEFWRDECAKLNEAFNHWIVHRTPFVTVKAAMTLDGKIATAGGESKWITGEKARAHGMKLRQGSDAILVGINTILADDPSLTARSEDGRWKRKMAKPSAPHRSRFAGADAAERESGERRICGADNDCREQARAEKSRGGAGKARERPRRRRLASDPQLGNLAPQIDLRWLLKKLGAENVTSLLVEGGGEVNASFLLGGLAQRVAFFYAPKILGGRDARKGVAGDGAKSLAEVVQLREVEWRKLGEDLLLTARVKVSTGVAACENFCCSLLAACRRSQRRRDACATLCSPALSKKRASSKKSRRQKNPLK